jgi:uncharacterized protein YdeI (YjbR/CyaY-like superfamily)
MAPKFFKNQAGFRKWLDANHKKERELFVGFYKVDSGKSNMTWSQSVDEALCYGWIDGVRKSIDDERYCIRFTPRKPTSTWSRVNIDKVEKLTGQGLMQPAGLEAFKNCKQDNSGIYSFESETKNLTGDFEIQFKSNKKAWDFFSIQAPSYRKAVVHWIMTAKQDATKFNRLQKTIAESEKQKRVYQT